MVKNPPANAGDADLIPELGRFPGGGNGNPLQYFCLGNPTDRGAWWGYSPWGHKRVRHDLATKPQQTTNLVLMCETNYGFQLLFFFNLYLGASSLSCSTWNLHCIMQDLFVAVPDSLVVVCGLSCSLACG